MTEEERKEQVTKIIDAVATKGATATAIFSQIPGVGLSTLTALYFTMAKDIAGLFERVLEEKAARKLVLAACERYAKAIFDKSMLSWIPLLGNGINAKMTFDLTRKVGWYFYHYFDQKCYEKTPE